MQKARKWTPRWSTLLSGRNNIHGPVYFSLHRFIIANPSGFRSISPDSRFTGTAVVIKDQCLVCGKGILSIWSIGHPANAYESFMGRIVPCFHLGNKPMRLWRWPLNAILSDCRDTVALLDLIWVTVEPAVLLWLWHFLISSNDICLIPKLEASFLISYSLCIQFDNKFCVCYSLELFPPSFIAFIYLSVVKESKISLPPEQNGSYTKWDRIPLCLGYIIEDPQ